VAGTPGAHEGLLYRLFGEAGVAERAHREAVELAGVRGVGLAYVPLAFQCPGLHPSPSTGRTQSGFKLYPSSFPILKIFVPQSGHTPWIAGRPFFMVTCLASWISTFFRSLTQ